MHALQQLLQQLIGYVPNVMGAIMILVVGYIVTKLVTSVLKKILKAIGVDKLGERLSSIDIIARSEIEISLSTVMAQIIYYFMMLIVLVASTDVLGMEMVSSLVGSAIAYVPNLIAAIIILIIGAILADILKEITTITCKSLAIPAAGMIGSIIFWFVFIALLITALSQAQLETNFIVANLSIILGGISLAFALSYGLAAKPIMGGFLAQFYNRGKINVGDKIRIEGVEGLIVSIDRASLTLRSNNQDIIVPLSKLQSETVHVLERANNAESLIENKEV